MPRRVRAHLSKLQWPNSCSALAVCCLNRPRCEVLRALIALRVSSCARVCGFIADPWRLGVTTPPIAFCIKSCHRINGMAQKVALLLLPPRALAKDRFPHTSARESYRSPRRALSHQPGAVALHGDKGRVQRLLVKHLSQDTNSAKSVSCWHAVLLRRKMFVVGAPLPRSCKQQEKR